MRAYREIIGDRQGWLCAYCGVRVTKKRATIDHVKPLSRGGTNARRNMVLACQPCNTRKADLSPNAAGMPLLPGARKALGLPPLGPCRGCDHALASHRLNRCSECACYAYCYSVADSIPDPEGG